MMFALAKALEDRAEYEESFRLYDEANRMQARAAPFDAGRLAEHVRRSVDTFTAFFMEQRANGGHADRSPIFIVGLPRSGTTLLEQILASHSQIEGLSELMNVEVIATELAEDAGNANGDYIHFLARMPNQVLAHLGRSYIQQAQAFRKTDRPFFVDKMPSNWQHLGLVRLILPHARIIHIHRDPLDCCFSNFAQYFPRGHEFSTSLTGLGKYYRYHLQMVDHFAALPPRHILAITYEQLVQDVAGEVERLLQFLDLPFEEGCLRFHESRRNILTPSAQQVRQPINDRSIGRAKPFDPWLAPLKSALAEGPSN